MGSLRIVEPADEPVTLAEAKLHLRQIDDAEDSLITLFLAAARRYVEHYCGRSLITQEWRLTLDAFPCTCMELERGPVQSVDSIVYLDMAGVLQTITDPGLPEWAIDLTGERARIAPGFGYTWPEALPQIGAVQVNYTTGFGDDATDVPEEIRQWILVRVNTAFENREHDFVAQSGMVRTLPYLDRLLDEHVVHRA